MLLFSSPRWRTTMEFHREVREEVWRMELVIIFAKILFKNLEDGVGDNICKNTFLVHDVHHL